jgi:hypothetical protein
MAVVMVLALGTLGATFLVTQSVRANRQSLTGAQAQMIAEWELEQIEGEGCSSVIVYPGNPCHNIKRLDGQVIPTVYWSADGPVRTAPTPFARPYSVAVDVDGTGTNPISGTPLFEGLERGGPALDLYAGQTMNLLNVRVTVSWDEPNQPTHAVVLQTRVAP